jgi:hypothetical protein
MSNVFATEPFFAFFAAAMITYPSYVPLKTSSLRA